MFSKLRLLLARIMMAIAHQPTPKPTAGNSAANPQLHRLALSHHYYATGFELMPRKLLNQRQRRKRCRQTGRY